MRVNISLRRLILPYLEEVVNKYHATANLVVLNNVSVMYLEKAEGSHSMRSNTLVGGEKPLYCTAVGKAMLAFLDEKDLEKITKGLSFQRYTDNTIVNLKILKTSLDKIKVKGYAEDFEEMEVGLSCIAAPIFNQYEKPFAAISVSGPSTRMRDDNLRKGIAEDLIKAANKISQKLGYRHI